MTYYIRFYRKLIIMDDGLLNKARLHILFACIVSFASLMSILTITYLTGPFNILLYRAFSFFALFSTALYVFWYHKRWRLAAHLFLTGVTLKIWTNVMLVQENVYLVNIQYSLLVIVAGYYILGSKVGLIYAIAAIFPVLLDVLLNDFLKISISFRLINVNYTGYGITLITNFILIVYIHHLFFSSLTKAKKRERFLNKGLKLALAESRELERAKVNFLNTMSHEIRTPLNAIVGMSNLLLSDERLPQQEENLQVLHFSADTLMATVNNIIDFNKLAQGQVHLNEKPFLAFNVITNIGAIYRKEATQKKLKFDFIIDDELKDMLVIGDELRLSQILFHLIGNAVKFTENGFVTIRIACVEKNGEAARIAFQISDSGIGISKEKKEQLVDPFKRKFLKTQRQNHITLGLTIVYELLLLHHSQLTISSTEGKGSTFYFIINYKLACQDEIATKELYFFNPTDDFSNIRVLIVDDEKLNLMIVKKVLAGWNVIPDEASNGKIAFDLCAQKNYDVILMDINMPIMDGFEASKAIKEINKKDVQPPYIIAHTASVGTAIDEVIKFPSIDDCILKPFKPEELKKKLRKIKPQ